MGHTTGPGHGPIEERIAEAVARERLGNHRASYVPARPSPAVLRSDLIVLSLFLLVMLSAGTVLARSSPVFLVFFAVPAVVLPASRLLREGRQRRARKDAGLHLYEDGLVVVIGGRLRAALRWDTMTVYQNIGRYHTFGRSNRIKHAYRLRGGEGEELTLREGFPHPEEWGPRIQQAVTEAQLADAIAALRAGRTLSFGNFQVSRTDVQAGRRRVPWPQVAGVSTRQGLVHIEVDGKRSGLSGDPVWMFPNLRLFTSLVEQLRR